jgi:hypothetical protein
MTKQVVKATPKERNNGQSAFGPHGRMFNSRKQNELFEVVVNS